MQENFIAHTIIIILVVVVVVVGRIMRRLEEERAVRSGRIIAGQAASCFCVLVIS